MHRFSLPILVTLAGCGADVFEVTETGRATVPGSPLGALISSLGPMDGLTDLDVAAGEEFKNQGVSKSDVDSVRAKRITLKIVDPANQDFSFLDRIEFWAEAEGRRARIGKKEGISGLGLAPPNPAFDLDLDEVDLAPFVTAPKMTIRTEASGRQPSRDTVLEATVVLSVDVNVL